MNDFNNVSPKFFTLTAFLVGYVLIDDFNAAAQNSLGNWFMLVGQTLESNSAQQTYVESKIQRKHSNINDEVIKKEYSPIIYDTALLKKLVNSNAPRDTFYIVENLEKAVRLMQIEIKEIKKIIGEANKN